MCGCLTTAKWPGQNRSDAFRIPDLRPVRGRPLLIMMLACLPAVWVLAVNGQFTGHPYRPADEFYELTRSRGKLSVFAVGLISRRENTDSLVRLYVSDLTFIYKDTVYKDTSSKTLIYADQAVPEAVPGNYLSCRGTISLPEKATCPGQFDAFSYMEASHVRSVIRNAKIEKIYCRFTLPGILASIRWQMGRAYERLYPKEDAGVIRAVTLGERGMVGSETQLLYSGAGISHILAVSGTHIALAGMGIYRILRKRRRSFLFSSAVSWVIVFSFGMMTGFGISSVRAIVMYSVWLSAQVLGKSYDAVQAALISAAAVLSVSPMNGKQAGFWLSFGCILSIHLAGPVFAGMFGKLKCARQLGTSLAVFSGTLPLVCRFFYQFSPYSLIINLPVIMLMPALMIMGLLSALAGSVCRPAGLFLSGGCRLILTFFRLLCEMILKLPFGCVVTGCPSLPGMAAAYGLFCAAVWICMRKKQKNVIRLILSSVFLIGMIFTLFRPQPAFQAVFLDVGQGDCTLIGAGSFHIMVDGGSSSDTDVWKHRISCALKYYGISRLDGVFVTHGDLDHYSGIESCLDRYASLTDHIKVGAFVTGENIAYDEDLSAVAHKAAENHIPVRTIHRKEEIIAGRLKIRCLFPSGGQCEELGDFEEKNIRSLVLEISYRDLVLLLPGDLEDTGEEMLVRSCRDEWETMSAPDKIRILKCGHHGSSKATGDELIRAFMPNQALISCGRNNRYGHPAKQVLERLEDAGVRIRRTDLEGTLILTSGKGEVRLEVYTN